MWTCMTAQSSSIDGRSLFAFSPSPSSFFETERGESCVALFKNTERQTFFLIAEEQLGRLNPLGEYLRS